MIFISAGHHLGSSKQKQDSGAVGNVLQENKVTVEFRDLVCRELDSLGAKYIKDSNDEPLATYLKRINTGNASVVIEFHCNASSIATAEGSTAVIGSNADKNDKSFAKEINDAFCTILGTKNRGVISETQTRRGRLGLMRESGIVMLQEMFFISNKKDVEKYNLNKEKLANVVAAIIVKYEALIS
jgi:N-acetylmuramoyl-L-alanine amidase